MKVFVSFILSPFKLGTSFRYIRLYQPWYAIAPAELTCTGVTMAPAEVASQ